MGLLRAGGLCSAWSPLRKREKKDVRNPCGLYTGQCTEEGLLVFVSFQRHTPTSTIDLGHRFPRDVCHQCSDTSLTFDVKEGHHQPWINLCQLANFLKCSILLCSLQGKTTVTYDELQSIDRLINLYYSPRLAGTPKFVHLGTDPKTCCTASFPPIFSILKP